MDCSARKRRPKQSLQCRRKVLLPDPSQSRVGVRCRWHGGNVPDPTYESSNDADCSGYDENTPEGDDDKMGEVEYDEPPDLKSKDKKEESGGGGMGGGESMPIVA